MEWEAVHRVFNLLDDGDKKFLDRDYASKEEFVAAYHLLRGRQEAGSPSQPKAVALAPDPDDIADTLTKPHVAGDVSPRSPVPESGTALKRSPKNFGRPRFNPRESARRRLDIERLDAALVGEGKGHTPCLAVVTGPLGSGKGAVVLDWYWERGKHIFGADAIRVKCDHNSHLATLPELNAHFGGTSGSEGLVEALRSTRNKLIVFDNLRLNLFMSSENQKELQSLTHNLRDLVQFALNLIETTEGLSVILLIERELNILEDIDFSKYLSTTVGYHQIFFGHLSDDEGAEYLSLLLSRPLEIEYRKAISRKLFGVPTSLIHAARALNRVSSDEVRSYASTTLFDPERFSWEVEDNLTDRVFSSYCDRYEDKDKRAVDPHPRALLRLLALMPGPTPKHLLNSILVAGHVRRLTKLRKIDQALDTGIPFVRSDKGLVDLHPAARALLRLELARVATTPEGDDTTNVKELLWIQGVCLRYYWRIIAVTPPRVPVTENVERFVHHAVAYMALLRDHAATGTTASLNAPLELMEGDGKRTGLISAWDALDTVSLADVWVFTYQRVVRQHLLGKNEGPEGAELQKLKAVTMQKLANVISDYWEPMPVEAMAIFYRDLAAYWMHAGQLGRAGNAVDQALATIARQTQSVMQIDPRKHEWLLRAEIKNLSLAIRQRGGHFEDEADPSDAFSSYVERATTILAAYRRNDGERYKAVLPEHSSTTFLGAVRVLTREADRLLQSGKVSDALTKFLEAIGLARLSGKQRHLTGEAARRRVVAMIRQKHGLKNISHVIRSNLKAIRDHTESAKYGLSVDIIPFHVLEAAILRIKGQMDEARATLDTLWAHGYVRRRECTFVALVELELEEIRWLIVDGSDKNRAEAATRSEALEKRMEDAGHLLLQVDAMLLRAELLAGIEREDLVYRARFLATDAYYFMRYQDCDVLMAGNSAIGALGL